VAGSLYVTLMCAAVSWHDAMTTRDVLPLTSRGHEML